MAKIVIIGAGVMGSALSWPLSDNGHEVYLVGTHLDHSIIDSCKQSQYHPGLKRSLPKAVIPCNIEELPNIITGFDLIISGVNSLGVRWIGKTLSPFLKPRDKIVAVTKGLEIGSGGSLSILPEVMQRELPQSIGSRISIAAIGGPCIASELAGRRQSCVVVASNDDETANIFKQYSVTSYYHVWVAKDLKAVEIAAALKNAYTVSIGYVYGFLDKKGGVDTAGAGMYNFAAALFAQACSEIFQILDSYGLDPSHAFTLAGAGDLYVTCQKGRSFKAGHLLGEGRTLIQVHELLKGETLEAILVINEMAKLLPFLANDRKFPLMNFLVDLIVNNQQPQLDLDHFFDLVN